MIRSIFSLRAASLLAGLLFAVNVHAAAGDVLLAPAEAQVSDLASLQRGAALYFNYCSSCHGIQYMRYGRIAKDLELSEDELMNNLVFTDAKPGDLIKAAMPAGGDAINWFGAPPPDLSLTARSRGVDWIYSYLKAFYVDPTRPLGWNNTVFPGASMPHVLWERQGVQGLAAHDEQSNAGHGKLEDQFELLSAGTRSSAEFDQDARDISNFLQYVGEPAALQRERYGVWVLLYLIVLTGLLYLLKHEYWRDVH